jgi:hypothetical protein
MIQIYYEDNSSQVIRPSIHFKPESKAIKELVEAIAGIYPVKYYVSDFETKRKNK